MNYNQKIIAGIGLTVVALLAVYPPWTRNDPTLSHVVTRGFIFSRLDEAYYHVNGSVLMAEIVCVLAATAAICLFNSTRPGSREHPV